MASRRGWKHKELIKRNRQPCRYIRYVAVEGPRPSLRSRGQTCGCRRDRRCIWWSKPGECRNGPKGTQSEDRGGCEAYPSGYVAVRPAVAPFCKLPGGSSADLGMLIAGEKWRRWSSSRAPNRVARSRMRSAMGPLADIAWREDDVRFCPRSGHRTPLSGGHLPSRASRSPSYLLAPTVISPADRTAFATRPRSSIHCVAARTDSRSTP